MSQKKTKGKGMKIFEEITVANFPKMGKEISTGVQEVQNFRLLLFSISIQMASKLFRVNVSIMEPLNDLPLNMFLPWTD